MNLFTKKFYFNKLSKSPLVSILPVSIVPGSYLARNILHSYFNINKNHKNHDISSSPVKSIYPFSPKFKKNNIENFSIEEYFKNSPSSKYYSKFSDFEHYPLINSGYVQQDSNNLLNLSSNINVNNNNNMNNMNINNKNNDQLINNKILEENIFKSYENNGKLLDDDTMKRIYSLIHGENSNLEHQKSLLDMIYGENSQYYKVSNYLYYNYL